MCDSIKTSFIVNIHESLQEYAPCDENDAFPLWKSGEGAIVLSYQNDITKTQNPVIPTRMIQSDLQDFNARGLLFSGE
jgi:hypothetical protein